MSQILVTGEAKVRDIQGPVVANSGVITALDGDASQYVRGDGTLADFPTSTGGGSSVSYYLNSSVSQGTIGGLPYRQLSKTPISGAGTDITASTNGYIANYITDANDPSLLEVPAGNFNCEFYFSVNSNAHNPYVFAELYKYNTNTAIFTLLGTSQSIPEYLTNGTTLSAYYFAIPVAAAALTITDRLAIRIYVNVDGRTVTLHTENNHLCQVVTTFSKGLTTLNNLTTQVQFFGTGTSGSDFNIVSSGSTHTFNIPNAGSGNRGLITSGSQTIAGAKSFGDLLTAANLNVSGVLTVFGNLANGTFSYTLPSANGQLALTSQIPSITGTANQVTRYNSAGSGLEGGSIVDFGTVSGTPPAGFVTINARLTVNNYVEVNRYLSIIQNVDSSWALPSTGTNLEAFITSAAGGLLISDTAYLRPRKSSDDTFKRFVIQGDDLILNDAVRRTLINKAGPTQGTTKVEVAGYTRFDNTINVNGVLQFNATDSVLPTYLQAPSGNVTLMTTGQITLGTNSVSKFIFDVNGALNLGTSDNSNIININNQFTTLNSTMQGVHITPSIVSANPVTYTGVKSFPQLFISGALNFADIKHFSALNASNTATTSSQIGLYVDNLTTNGLAYGIQSTLSSGTGKYNLYIDGTAINYLKGRLGVDQSNPQYAIDVTGDVNVTGNFKVNGTNLTQGISGGGTQNYIPRYTSATTVGDSKLYQNPATNHVLVNTTTDYSGSGGYLQVGGGFTTESFANIIYGSALYVGNTVTLSLVNGNTIQGIGDRTYFIENRVNTGGTTANYYLNYWDGSSISTRYSLDNTGLHSFSGQVSISGATTIGGTLTGASGTFSGSVGIGTTTGISASVTIYNTSEANQLKLAGAAPAAVFTDALTSATHVAAMGLVTAPNNFIAGTVAGEFVFANQTNKAIIFGTGLSTTEKMRITSGGRLLLGTTTDNGSLLQVNGAATFSSSVTSTIANGYFLSAISATTSEIYARIGNTSGFLSIGCESSTGGTIVGGSSAYAAIISQYQNNPLQLATNNLVRLTITGSGNVGIGTSSPAYKLDVRGTYDAAGIISVRSTNTATIDVGGVLGFGGFHNASANESQWAWIKGAKENSNGNDNASYLAFATMVSGGSPTEKMRITSGGDAGIGTSTISLAATNRRCLEVNGAGTSIVAVKVADAVQGYMYSGGVNGDLYFSRSGTSGNLVVQNVSSGVYLTVGATSWSAVSDIRLKNINSNIDNALNKLMTLSTINFSWKSDETNQENLGFIAQEVEKVFPQVITKLKINGNLGNESKDDTEYLSVKYTDMIPVLVAAIQEQQTQIELLSNKIVALESK
jgi:hypothetical protein